MTKKVFALDTKPGIQRDGTLFDKEFYVDGRWVRFQRGRPRKIGGYRLITDQIAGPSRGIFVVPRSTFNNIYNGYSDGLQLIPVDDNGTGSGITDYTFGGSISTTASLDGGSGYVDGTYTGVPLIYVSTGAGSGATATITVASNVVTTVVITGGGFGYLVYDELTAADANLGGGGGSGFSVRVATVASCFTPSQNNLWQFDTFTDSSGSGANLLLAHPSQDLGQIDSEINTPVMAGPLSGTHLNPIGVFTEVAATVTSGSKTVTLATSNINIGAGQVITGPGIAANTTVEAVSLTNLTLSQNATANGTNVTLTFDNQVSVSGGVVSLHPYVFVYGNDGLIRNCAAGNIDDWVSEEANEVNVATGKIVQGLPVRGGSNAPSGLFWSLDSIIRVSFAPQSLGVPGTGNFAPTTYWRYDIISSQSSMLSSQSVIEYDGVYFWCGVDRFLLYNGVVKEIPNSMNQNWFFDNLNYVQRQKVWATKVPRFGEIWWFYPRGNSEECNDAIIYNIRENVWYDAGTALGSRRSAGYFSQVFRFPIKASWDENYSGGVLDTTLSDAGSGYADATYSYESLTGGTGSGATATIVVSGGSVVSVQINNRGTGYSVGDTLTATLDGVGIDFELTVNTTMSFVSLWQHEVGTDEVAFANVNAIESFFETSDLGWVAGGPSQPSPVGENKWLRIERVEPDFLQSGDMDLYITGRPYAQEQDQTTGPYTFAPGTGKIDMKEQRRELRMKFVSNVTGGNYQLGKVIVNADIGDVRGYST
jgi:hypothetical protein